MDNKGWEIDKMKQEQELKNKIAKNQMKHVIKLMEMAKEEGRLQVQSKFINVKEDRKAIKDIIYKNLKLIEMAGNKEGICQELADGILLHFIEKGKNKKWKLMKEQRG